MDEETVVMIGMIAFVAVISVVCMIVLQREKRKKAEAEAMEQEEAERLRSEPFRLERHEEINWKGLSAVEKPKEEESTRPARSSGPSESDASDRGSNLVACPDCGRMVSRSAVTCPGCGRPMASGARSAGTGGRGGTSGAVVFIAVLLAILAAVFLLPKLFEVRVALNVLNK